MRRLSLIARRDELAETPAQVEILLMRISHDDLDEPVYLSTDATVRLTSDPLTYGTQSRWPEGGDLHDFQFILVDALVPDDDEESIPALTLAVEVVDREMAKPLLAVSSPAVVDFCVVTAADVDTPDVDYRGFWLMAAEGDSGQITLTIVARRNEGESFGYRRLTKHTAPGAFP